MTKYLHFNNSHYGFDKMTNKVAKKYQSRTVAVRPELPREIRRKAEAFMNAGPGELTITILLGIALVNPVDRYEKKVGRQMADSKMKETNALIRGITITETHIFLHLHDIQGCRLNLRLNKTTGYSTVTGRMVLSEGKEEAL